MFLTFAEQYKGGLMHTPKAKFLFKQMLKIRNFQEDPKLAGQRRKLVVELRNKGIVSERVLEAIGKVPRQLFFPSDFVQFVYRDAAFPIGFGQTISQPYTVAFQTQLMEIQPGDKVLEIGTGSGYQAAILSCMEAEVYSVEIIKDLLLSAGKVLKNLDIPVKLFHGDGSLGLSQIGDFDAILVTAGAKEIPQVYLNQLKTGGRLIIPIGPDLESLKMQRVIKLGPNSYKTETFGDFKFVPLVGENGWTSN